jgi:putative tricarboxylic transport membrane protein
MSLSGGDLAIFYTSPTALVFFGLAALIIGLQVAGGRAGRKRNKTEVESSNA